jgi:hypothetical protein
MESIAMPRAGTRRKVHKDQTAEASSPPPADNGPNEETVLFFAGEIRRKQIAARAASKALTSVKRMAKNAGLYTKELIEAIDNQELDPEIVAATFKRRAFYNQALNNVPKGTQLDIFDVKLASSIPTSVELAERAYRQGYIRGVTGDDPDTDAYGIGHPQENDHKQGWHAGRKVYDELSAHLAAQIKQAPDEKAEGSAPQPEEQQQESVQ